MTTKELYRVFCQGNADVPLFSQYDWLSNVFADKDWDVLIEANETEVFACLPVHYHRKMGLTKIATPMLNTYSGIQFFYPAGQKKSTRYSFEQDMCERLIKQLPAFDAFDVKFYPQYTCLLPFEQKSFSIKPQITYIIPFSQRLEDMTQNYKSSVWREVSKAEKTLSCVSLSSTDELCLIKQQMSEQADLPLASKNYVDRIWHAAKKLNRGCMLAASDDKKTEAVFLFVWDSKQMYYLYGGTSPDAKTSGASSFVLNKAIEKAHSLGLSFNFCGSMLPGIERFFRNFGGEREIYYRISKVNSALLKGKKMLDSLR